MQPLKHKKSCETHTFVSLLFPDGQKYECLMLLHTLIFIICRYTSLQNACTSIAMNMKMLDVKIENFEAFYGKYFWKVLILVDRPAPGQKQLELGSYCDQLTLRCQVSLQSFGFLSAISTFKVIKVTNKTFKKLSNIKGIKGLLTGFKDM